MADNYQHTEHEGCPVIITFAEGVITGSHRTIHPRSPISFAKRSVVNEEQFPFVGPLLAIQLIKDTVLICCRLSLLLRRYIAVSLAGSHIQYTDLTLSYQNNNNA